MSMSFSSDKIRVGVLRGGPSAEYNVSLKTGAVVLANLPEEYESLDVFISKDGIWHIDGLEKNPYKILRTIDVAMNALHGSYGEDGTVQKLLENFHIPYTGSDSISSAIGMNKILSKNVFNQHGLKTPHYIIIEKDDVMKITNEMLGKINENLVFPIIIKPFNLGSSIGVSFASNIGQVKNALEKSFEHSPKLIVEEYIKGKEATCGVIEDFRDKDIYALLPMEIEKINGRYFYDYNSKYIDLETRNKVPGNFTEEESESIQDAASLIHKILGLKDYSRSDFILHPRRGLFAFEVNTLPEITHHSSFIKSLEAVGGNIREFLSHILNMALNRQ